MPSEPRGLPHHRGGIALHLPRHLPVAGAGEHAVEELLLELGAFEVVGGGEGLRAESPPALATAITRDGPRFTLALVGAEPDPLPACGTQVEAALGPRAMRGNEGREIAFHRLRSSARSRPSTFFAAQPTAASSPASRRRV